MRGRDWLSGDKKNDDTIYPTFSLSKPAGGMQQVNMQ
eukprot:COSAG01_NODE_69918_length_260_cov_0.627329_1_plen_36_part_10